MNENNKVERRKQEVIKENRDNTEKKENKKGEAVCAQKQRLDLHMLQVVALKL